jgi:hypothetical protein
MIETNLIMKKIMFLQTNRIRCIHACIFILGAFSFMLRSDKAIGLVHMVLLFGSFKIKSKIPVKYVGGHWIYILALKQ